MRVDDLLKPVHKNEEMQMLKQRCSQFLEQSEGRPLFKNLPSNYNDFHKVKVRKRRQIKGDCKLFAETFNEAFENELRDLRERAIFSNGELSFQPSTNQTQEPFYIFPIDGYKFMYSKEVGNSSQDYKTVFDAVYEQFGADKGNEVIEDLLKFTYTSENLREGIDQGAEIILYNIPYFYAVRSSVVGDYQELLSSLNEIK